MGLTMESIVDGGWREGEEDEGGRKRRVFMKSGGAAGMDNTCNYMYPQRFVLEQTW